MGICWSKKAKSAKGSRVNIENGGKASEHPSKSTSSVVSFPFASTPSPPIKKPSPSRHLISKRSGNVEKPLHKKFGYPSNISAKYKLGSEIGRGHFGRICKATVNVGDSQGQTVAVKIISKAEMMTDTAIEDVQKEVKILSALSGHANIVQFYDAYEDSRSVYIVMELCTGGELLDHILARGGRYAEEDAKEIVVQMLNAVNFIHLQGVVHRDLKPENFLFTTETEGCPLKTIDFGLSDFVKPYGKLNDMVGSAYYVAPEVIKQSYDTQADVWSLGVIVYILLSGNRPFWAETENELLCAVTEAQPSYDDISWTSVSPEAKDFVSRLLKKDTRTRMTAAQALAHPWIRDRYKIPLDLMTLKSVGSYLQCSSLKRSALKALAKTLIKEDFFYLGEQFMLLKPSADGGISLENIKLALMKSATQAMKDSQTLLILKPLSALSVQNMYFPEFCAAAINVHQLEMSACWAQRARKAYENFNRKGNRYVAVDELPKEEYILGLLPALHNESMRLDDGKLSFTGFTKLLLA